MAAEENAIIAVAGSITLVRWLIRERLLDELELMIHPIVIGNGEKLFATGLDSITFDLAQSAVFATGVLDLIYRRSAAAADQTAQNRRS